MSMSDDIRLQTDGIQRSWTDCVCQCMGHQCIIEFASSSSSPLCVLGSFFLVDVILIPEYTDVHVMRLQTRQHRNSSSRFPHILLSIMRKNSFLSIHISIVHIQAVCVYERECHLVLTKKKIQMSVHTYNSSNVMYPRTFPLMFIWFPEQFQLFRILSITEVDKQTAKIGFITSRQISYFTIPRSLLILLKVIFVIASS